MILFAEKLQEEVIYNGKRIWIMLKCSNTLESAKSRVWRACVLTCSASIRACVLGVLASLRTWRAFVLTFSRVYVLTCLRHCVYTCLACFLVLSTCVLTNVISCCAQVFYLLNYLRVWCPRSFYLLYI